MQRLTHAFDFAQRAESGIGSQTSSFYPHADSLNVAGAPSRTMPVPLPSDLPAISMPPCHVLPSSVPPPYYTSDLHQRYMQEQRQWHQQQLQHLHILHHQHHQRQLLAASQHAMHTHPLTLPHSSPSSTR